MGDDLTVEILKQIRDGVTGVRDEVRSEIGALRNDVRAMGNQIGERIDKLEAGFGRVERGLSDLGTFMRGIASDQQRHENFHSHHVDLLE